MRKLMWLSCVVFVSMMVSSVSGEAVPILVGDFESPAVGGRYDGWWEDGLTIVNTTTPAAAITRGTHALKGTTTVGGWGPGWQFNFSSFPDGYDTALAPEACLVVDYTGFAADFTGGAQLGTTLNCAAPTGGWDKSGFQDMVLDGLPHRMVFFITPAYKTAILAAKNALSWGANLGVCLNMGTGNATLYIDNVWLLPTPPQDELLPNTPAVDQVENGATEAATFNWKAAADPNKNSGLPVNPDIVDQYVFINTNFAEPNNLYYQGKTGVDPGTEPISQFGPVSLVYNKTYKWAVVEVMAGHQQTLTANSTLANVDPNNLTGPIWRFNSISTIPVISAQPVNGRAPLGATNVTAFTIGVASLSPPSYQWYNSADNVRDAGDFALTSPSATTNTLVLGATGITMSHQKYYYCKVSNLATVSGGGTLPDVYSNVVTFVPERIVAQYQFENNFNDSAPVTTDRHNGTGVNGPAFVTGGIEGTGTYALSLNGTNQYVTLGTAGYPKAVLTGAGGIGGGLDIGSVLCWVKATKAGAILSNADPNGRATLQVETNGGGSITVRGGTTQMGYASALSAPDYNLINDGNWHLLAATWDKNSDVRMYVDTTRVQTNATNVSFAAWMYSGLIGADRLDSDYAVPTSFFGGLLDNLRVYNYRITAEAIAQEYFDKTGTRTCINSAFTGSIANLDNAGTSYCKVDLADFAILAQDWLTNGFYP